MQQRPKSTVAPTQTLRITTTIMIPTLPRQLQLVMNATLESWQKRKRRIKSITITAIKKWTVHTPLTTHLTAWFCQDPLFFGWVAVLLWLHLPVCVCVCLFAPCVQVYLRLTTTQYHSVWTLNGSPSSKATRLLCCFTQVSDRVFTT